MNQEIKKILESMELHTSKNLIADSNIQKHLSIQSSRLSVLLAEEAAIQNEIITKHAEKTVRLTRAIHILTWVMIFVGVAQIFVAVYKPH
jgi:hypothetical protein